MITEREFLERTHLDSGTLEIWIRESWICPDCTAPERTFTDMDLARANLIRDLKMNMGVNDEGLDVILHLIDQMHGLRRALADALARLREREKGIGGL
jgi:chaperone modulatory protein CbpM